MIGRRILWGFGLLVACGTDPVTTSVSSSGEAASTEPSETALCAEHGVVEAVCPQCTPSLAAVFQAKGDWCDEHGFPESFCPICHPERGGRPAVADLSGDDGAPADGTVVRFKERRTAEAAGLQVVPAQVVPWEGGATAVARIAWDATRVARVGATAAGVVTHVLADVGARVQAGETLAILRSPEAGTARARQAASRRALEVARAEAARLRGLVEAGVSSERQAAEAERAVALAEATLAEHTARVDLIGAGSGDEVRITAPLAGVVTERLAAMGQSVGPTEPLFQVVDPSRMWAELDVAEADLGSVAVGQPVRVTLHALPDRTFEGSLTYLAPSVDPESHTARGRVVLDNPDGALRAHLFGEATVITETADRVVSVPREAVQEAAGAQLVFVRQAVDEYVARRVRVRARQGDVVRVEGPLHDGDPVVTTGSFLLKTETLRDQIGAGCCDVE